MTCPVCETIDQGDCQCSIIENDCFTMDGDGSVERPFVPSANLDPDPNNLLSCSVAGLLAILPPDLLDPPRVQAYSSVALTLADEDWTVLDLNAERFDTDTMHDNATNNSRVTFTTAGIYIVTLNVTFAGDVDGDRLATIRMNGTDTIALVAKHAANSASIDMGMSVTVHRSFEAGEYVEARCKQDSGGNLNILSNRYSPTLSAIWRRAAA